ncbi:uncharacterized protein LOC62_03G005165 [Vanrija pseudolonga]|uniref:F-box domain-containing protein n=1 Tax=Vanrija pseudolonga TaxID=143232 RepID=A0AAF1BIK3_9TREE|nr:hypothetical protein LOC62_03G005165 [Vanrija pseudolonga]
MDMDSRAIYILDPAYNELITHAFDRKSPVCDGAKWVMGVHAFDRPRPCSEPDADIVLRIGGFLPPADLVSANQVCRGWRAALGSSSAPWRAACVDTYADGADRFEAIPPAPDGVPPDLHTWRTLGVMLFRSGAGPDSYGIPCRMLADRLKFERVCDLSVDRYASIEATHNVVVRTRDDGWVIVSNVVRRAGVVELDKVARLRPVNRASLTVMGTHSGPVSCLCEPIQSDLRVYAPPLWRPVDILRAGRSGVGMDMESVFLSRQMFALTMMGTTTIYYRPSYGEIEPRAKFPFGHQKCASLAFDFRLQLTAPGLHYADAMVEGDEGFEEVVDSSEPATSAACFNNTDMAVVVRGPKLLILRNYLDVFEAVVHLPEAERNSYIATRTIALAFDRLASRIKAHGHRFVVRCGATLVVIDSRDLPAVPPPPGPYPAVSLHVLVLPYPQTLPLFAIDSRAVCMLDHYKRMTVHSFDN